MELTIREITKRIYNLTIYMFECKRTEFEEIYKFAKDVVNVFDVNPESEDALIICSLVATKYVLSHGQPKNK